MALCFLVILLIYKMFWYAITPLCWHTFGSVLVKHSSKSARLIGFMLENAWLLWLLKEFNRLYYLIRTPRAYTLIVRPHSAKFIARSLPGRCAVGLTIEYFDEWLREPPTEDEFLCSTAALLYYAEWRRVDIAIFRTWYFATLTMAFIVI